MTNESLAEFGARQSPNSSLLKWSSDDNSGSIKLLYRSLSLWKKERQVRPTTYTVWINPKLITIQACMNPTGIIFQFRKSCRFSFQKSLNCIILYQNPNSYPGTNLAFQRRVNNFHVFFFLVFLTGTNGTTPAPHHNYHRYRRFDKSPGPNRWVALLIWGSIKVFFMFNRVGLFKKKKKIGIETSWPVITMSMPKIPSR